MKLYDFVAVAERLEESLLVLARKLGVSKNDVLYLSSKKAGDDCSGQIKPYTPLKDRPQVVREAAERYRHGKDVELVALANEALDRAIGNYDGYQQALQEFKQQLAVVSKECSEHACNQCMWGDLGC